MPKSKKLLLAACIIAFLGAAGLCAVALVKYFKLSLATELEWAIGIYSGHSPFDLADDESVSNPVLTREQVRDVAATLVADPFVIRDGSKWYMFCEVFDSTAGRGKIGVAVSDDGLKWRYERIVLEEPFHLSYPYVFRQDGEFYLIPESGEASSVRLYQATDFPWKWKLVANLLEGDFEDTSIIHYNELWWLFTCTSPTHDELKLYFSDSLLGPWISHPKNPIVRSDPSIARPGGRLIVYQEGLIRFTQDDKRTYGKAVRAFRITRISRTDYSEEPVLNRPIIKAHGTEWARHGMHHVDPTQIGPDKWLAAVDGYKKHLVIRLEY
jgi:hypothetical protein